jgi:site-specific DNA-adenine methylase
MDAIKEIPINYLFDEDTEAVEQVEDFFYELNKPPQLKPPFPYYGGKRLVAGEVWSRLGDPDLYIEPFLGMAAVLLARPLSIVEKPRLEVVNDKNGFITNFWRAVKNNPDKVVHYASGIVSEMELHARNTFLFESCKTIQKRLYTNPLEYSCKVAGYWAYAMGLRIGVAGAGNKPYNVRPKVLTKPKNYDVLFDLQRRLKDVQSLCRDWKRLLTKTALSPARGKDKIIGVFLDPPYKKNKRSKAILYGEHDSYEVAEEVYQWGVEHGEDKKFRIVMCGNHGDFEPPQGWLTLHWTGHAHTKKTEECLWFSPWCLNPRAEQWL